MFEKSKSIVKTYVMKHKAFANILRFVYQKTILKYQHYKKQQLFLKNAPYALKIINEAFKELNVFYWLEYGTLLGAIRDQDIIGHDYDIDLGLFLDDHSGDIQTILEKHGLKKKKVFLIDDGAYGREETYVYKNISIDLFYFIKTDNNFYSHSFRNEEGKSWPKTIEDNGGLLVEEVYFPYSGFSKMIFLGEQYSIPDNYHEHLKAHYGENYLIKDASWDYRLMAKNITILKNKLGQYIEYP